MARQLQQFHGILEGSLEDDQTKQQWENILKKNPLTASLVGFLRKEAGKKCREKINNLAKADPNTPVPLQGTSFISSQQNEVSSINSIPTDDLSSSINAVKEHAPVTAPKSSDNSRPPRKRSRNDDDHNGIDDPCDKFESSRDTVMDIFERNYKISEDEKGVLSQLECLHCDFVFTGGPRIMRNHLVAVHPETLFAETKTPNLSEKTFIDCVRELLERKTEMGRVEAKRREKTYTKCGMPMYCVPCEMNYADVRSYKYHLITEHYDTLRRELARLQEEFSESQTERGSSQGGSMGKKFKCSVEEGGCGKTLASEANLQRHKNESCPRNQPQISLECKRVDGGCGKSFARRMSLITHQRNSCPKLGPKGRRRARNLKISWGSERNSKIAGEEYLDDESGPKILYVSGNAMETSSITRSSQESRERSASDEMEVMDEDPEYLEGEGGAVFGTDGSAVFAESEVKEEMKEKSCDMEFDGMANSKNEDDSLFECHVFKVKSE